VYSKPTITRKELEGVLDCLINDELVHGDAVRLFEKALADALAQRFCVCTGSATAAWHLAYTALGVGAGDKVIIPSFFPLAPLNALKLTGAEVLLVDIETDTLLPDPDKLKALIDPSVKAIALGHMTGLTSNLTPFAALGPAIIEDISHAAGTEIEGKPAGSYGAITVMSFTPDNIITTCSGGAVLTSNSRHYAQIRDLRYSDKAVHFDYSMTDLQGAMGASQLSRLQDFIRRRREIASAYHEHIRLTPHKPLYAFNPDAAYQAFPVFFDAANDAVEKYWKKNSIQVAPPVSCALHTILGAKPMDFPNSDRLSRKLYSLPIYPSLSRREIERIGRNLARFI
jgi:dTDP-4-amino-4,6-dideoxygalactose transaminase